jgi:hypothetical protein
MSPEPEDFSSHGDEGVERILSPAEEHMRLPKWRRDAARKRVREMRMELGTI